MERHFWFLFSVVTESVLDLLEYNSTLMCQKFDLFGLPVLGLEQGTMCCIVYIIHFRLSHYFLVVLTKHNIKLYCAEMVSVDIICFEGFFFNITSLCELYQFR